MFVVWGAFGGHCAHNTTGTRRVWAELQLVGGSVHVAKAAHELGYVVVLWWWWWSMENHVVWGPGQSGGRVGSGVSWGGTHKCYGMGSMMRTLRTTTHRG